MKNMRTIVAAIGLTFLSCLSTSCGVYEKIPKPLIENEHFPKLGDYFSYTENNNKNGIEESISSDMHQVTYDLNGNGKYDHVALFYNLSEGIIYDNAIFVFKFKKEKTLDELKAQTQTKKNIRNLLFDTDDDGILDKKYKGKELKEFF